MDAWSNCSLTTNPFLSYSLTTKIMDGPVAFLFSFNMQIWLCSFCHYSILEYHPKTPPAKLNDLFLGLILLHTRDVLSAPREPLFSVTRGETRPGLCSLQTLLLLYWSPLLRDPDVEAGELDSRDTVIASLQAEKGSTLASCCGPGQVRPTIFLPFLPFFQYTFLMPPL